MKLLLNSLRPALIDFMAALILKWFSKALIASSPFFPTKIRLTVLKCQKLFIRLVVGTARIFTSRKTKRGLHDRKTEHFKGITSACHASALADHVTSTGHNLKWDHLEILAKGRSDIHCKIKETLLIQELKPTLNDNVSSEKLYLY